MADSGTTVVFVHMHPEPQAASFFARYGVSDLNAYRTRMYALPRFRCTARAMTSWLSLGSAALSLGDAPRPHADTGRGRRRPMSAVIRIVDDRIDRDLRDAGFAGRPDFDDLLACPIG